MGSYFVDRYVHPNGVEYPDFEMTVHEKNTCQNPERCNIHNPSSHHMLSWPQVWRADLQKMQRICPHGVRHPDPDDAAYRTYVGQHHKNKHKCDGCCTPEPVLPEMPF